MFGREYPEAISLLAINTSSAGDIEFGGENSCILKVGLETPIKKVQKLGGKFSEKTCGFGVGMELKKVHKLRPG